MVQNLFKSFKTNNTGSDVMKRKDIYIILLSIILIVLIVCFVSSRKENGNTESINTKLESNEINNISKTEDNEEKDQKLEENKVEEVKTEENKQLEPQEPVVTSEPINNVVVKSEPQEVVKKEEPQVIIKKEESQTLVEHKEEVKVKQAVSTEEQTENQVLETKYGVKKIKVLHYNVIKYDDGTSDKNFNYDEIIYDKSGYNASTSDVMNEARSVAAQNSGIYSEITNYTNNYRTAAGVGTVVLDNELSVAATIRALEMAYTGGVFDISHTRPNGTECFSIFKEFNFTNITSGGENVAAGQKSASAAATAWYNSPGHRANMEDPTFKKIGVGMYELDGIKYWVQLFIG